MLEGEQIYSNINSKYFDFFKNQNPNKLIGENLRLTEITNTETKKSNFN